MDAIPQRRRWQFGLRSLLLLILALTIGLALYRAIPPDRPLLGGRLWVGATRENVVDALGEPSAKARQGKDVDMWYYTYPVDVNNGRSERRMITVFFVDELVVSAWDQLLPVRTGRNP